jgi:hypothetical protein
MQSLCFTLPLRTRLSTDQINTNSCSEEGRFWFLARDFGQHTPQLATANNRKQQQHTNTLQESTHSTVQHRAQQATENKKECERRGDRTGAAAAILTSIL